MRTVWEASGGRTLMAFRIWNGPLVSKIDDESCRKEKTTKFNGYEHSNCYQDIQNDTYMYGNIKSYHSISLTHCKPDLTNIHQW